MTAPLFAIVAGLCLAGFIIFPFGASTTSGTRFATREPFSWSKWREEASVSLWALNPVTIFRDVRNGYDGVGDAAVRLFGFIAVVSALLTAATLVGWGLFGWLL